LFISLLFFQASEFLGLIQSLRFHLIDFGLQVVHLRDELSLFLIEIIDLSINGFDLLLFLFDVGPASFDIPLKLSLIHI